MLSAGLRRERPRPDRAPPFDPSTRLERARATEQLARWLVEAGRRKRGMPRAAFEACAGAGTPHALFAKRFGQGRLPHLSVLAVLALAYLQYFLADTLLKFYSLHSLIVFVLVNGKPPLT